MSSMEIILELNFYRKEEPLWLSRRIAIVTFYIRLLFSIDGWNTRSGYACIVVILEALVPTVDRGPIVQST